MEKWQYNTDQYTQWEITYKIKDEDKSTSYIAQNKDIYEAIKELRNNKNDIEKLLTIRDVARTGSNYEFNKLNVLDKSRINSILNIA